MASHSQTDSDERLIQRCKRGDQVAYGQIVRRYQALVCSVAYSRCGDLTMSEDLAQDAFLQAWEKLAELREADRFKGWVCTIVRNLATRQTHRERKSVVGKAGRIEAAEEVSAEVVTPDQQVVANEEAQLVWQTLEGMPDAYREPLVLFYREDQSVARVAESLDLSVDAAKQRLSRGRRMLQAELAATVEKTLANSKPSSAFTAAVLTGLGGLAPGEAVAGVAATAKAAGGGLAKAGASGVGGAAWLATLAPLPVIGWMIKNDLDQSRSSREWRLRVRFYVRMGLFNAPLIAAMFALIWWQNHLPEAVQRYVRSLPWVFQVVAMVPILVESWRLGKAIERLREEEGTASPLRPLCEASGPTSLPGKTLRVFALGGFLVIAWPAALAVRAGDGAALAGMLALTGSLSAAMAVLSRWLPQFAFQCYAVTLPLTMLVGLGFVMSAGESWRVGPSYTSWHTIVLVGMAMTTVILTTLMHNRVAGKETSSEGRP